MSRPTINDVRQAFKEVEGIERPDADNEGDPLNSSSVFNYLSEENKKKVVHAEKVAMDYARNPAGEPNNRAIGLLKRNGFPTYLNQDQYDPYRYVGTVSIGDWTLDISDLSSGEEDSR